MKLGQPIDIVTGNNFGGLGPNYRSFLIYQPKSFN